MTREQIEAALQPLKWQQVNVVVSGHTFRDCKLKWWHNYGWHVDTGGAIIVLRAIQDVKSNTIIL